MEKGCYMVAVGKDAIVDGSVMVARSCNALGDHAQQVIAVPRRKNNEATLKFEKSSGVEIQVRETYGYLSVMAVDDGEPMFTAMGGINEFQVSAGASTGGYINKSDEKVCPKIPTCLGDYRMTLVLERCHTSREAGVRRPNG